MYDKEDKAQYIRYFNSNTKTITSRKFIEDFINDVITGFTADLEEAKLHSNLVYDGIDKLSIKTCKSKQVFGKSFIELPQAIKNKNACVNIKNTDDKYFMWSLLAYKYYDEIKNKDKNQTKYYTKYVGEIIEPKNFKYPVKITDIEEFEIVNNFFLRFFLFNYNFLF